MSEEQVKRAKVASLTPDNRNANRGTQRGRGLLEKSLRNYGAGRSILLDRNGRIIAGNKTTEVAADIGLEDVLIIPTDGTKLVAVQRTDLDLDSKEGRMLAYADNQVGAVDLDFDPSQIEVDVMAGLPLEEFFTPEELGDFKLDAFEERGQGEKVITLAARFGAPPFSVLDARQGYWQERKRAWIALGIQSELGRGQIIQASEDEVKVSEVHLVLTGANRKKIGAATEAILRGGGKKIKGKAPAVISGAPMPLDRAKTSRANATPGGGLMPATSLGADGKTVRGDGRGRPVRQYVNGTLMTSDSGNDPEYYYKKQQVERALGREISTAEFQERYYQGPETYQSGTSIFDPVLCELMYSWFTKYGDAVLDPFAGGSVRGITAGYLGRRYTGIDLRGEQVEANRIQAALIGGREERRTTDPGALTPVQRLGQILVKRDDLFEYNGARGGKVRSCLAISQGAEGLVTAGSRHSPQINIVAHVAAGLGIPARAHTPTGELSQELQQAQELGLVITQHRAGYNNVIIARAREEALSLGYREIPFGMECQEAVEQTRRQVSNLPWGEFTRLVVPVGSGMSLAGILWGLKDAGQEVPVLGVRVGADPEERLNKYAPPDWASMVKLEQAPGSYDEPAALHSLGHIMLDPYYEAKTLPYLVPGDLLWVVGVRSSIEGPAGVPFETPAWIVGNSVNSIPEEPFDFIFSCPPYYDLEIYSDDPEDLSNMESYEDFLQVYRDIITRAAARLEENRFACFVVGDLRDKSGYYRGFISDTIEAFQAVGCKLYNEAILVTALGSLPIRVNNQFQSGRKLGKTHQNILVFVKGDWRKAVERLGPVYVARLEDEAESDGTFEDLK